MGYTHYWDRPLTIPDATWDAIRRDFAGIKRHIILCYVPAPEVIAGVEFEVRRNIANQLLQQGYITGEVYEKVVSCVPS